jgi:hypothetical protein
MLDQWILSKLDPLRPAALIILRDPQRMIQPGAYVVHGWGEANGYAVFFCTGNMGLREMAERERDDAEARVLLVDRSRADGRYPLFYPRSGRCGQPETAAHPVVARVPRQPDRRPGLAASARGA